MGDVGPEDRCRCIADRMLVMSDGLTEQQPPIHVAPAFIQSATYSLGRLVTVTMWGHLTPVTQHSVQHLIQYTQWIRLTWSHTIRVWPDWGRLMALVFEDIFNVLGIGLNWQVLGIGLGTYSLAVVLHWKVQRFSTACISKVCTNAAKNFSKSLHEWIDASPWVRWQFVLMSSSW